MTVTHGTHALVIQRDRQCIAALLDNSHECADRWGTKHHAADPDKLTVEHVREHPGGMRRDDEGWLVAMCHSGNVVEHWGSSTENRRMLNIYLRGIRAAVAR